MKNQRKGFKSKKIVVENLGDADEVDILLAQGKDLYEKMVSKLPDAIQRQEAKIQADSSKLTMMKTILQQYQGTQAITEQKQVKNMTKAMTFDPKRLREMRVAKGLSQSAFARKIDYSPSTVSNAECGNYTPGPSFIEKAAKVLDVPKESLLN